MDSVIAVLPPHVIDQIAAGEVVERPASVVKELVDNALDAGARTITVETQAGGRALIRVCDDGIGMSPTDAVRALERHATSKLRGIDDLWGIASMGFRGEALAAIASVSRLTLTTRRAGDLAATRVTVEGGRGAAVTEVGAPAGTTIEVADLLHNVPARLKFLKGEATEASHVTELVGKLAMAHPHLHLKLRHNGRTALELPPERDGFARAQALLGARVAARLVPVSGEEAGVRITAYLAAPELAQTTARGVQLFVGRRPVRDRGLLHAVAMGYGELVPRGRYPVAVVHVDVPPGAVDVNVHPQKAEVRFADGAAVAAAVRHVVQAGVAAAAWRAETGAAPVQMLGMVAPPSLPFDAPATALSERYARDLRRSVGGHAAGQGSLFEARGDAARPSPSARAWVAQVQERTRAARAAERRELDEPAAVARTPLASPIARAPHAGIDGADGPPAPLHAGGVGIDGGGPRAGAVIGGAAARTEGVLGDGAARRADNGAGTGHGSVVAHAGIADDRSPDGIGGDGAPADGTRGGRTVAHAAARDLAEGSGPAPAVTATPGYYGSLRYLGQLDLTYLVCEAQGELVLVDQHAAHERVALARLLARHSARDVAVQKMLFPVTVEVTPAQLALVARAGDVLAEVGFEAEAFGKTTLAIKAVPSGIRHGDPAQLLRRLLGEWAREGGLEALEDDREAWTSWIEERVARVLAEIACHSVVRAGDRLASGEAEALLRGLDDVDPSTPQPHGKALLLRLPLAEIGRRFGR